MTRLLVFGLVLSAVVIGGIAGAAAPPPPDSCDPQCRMRYSFFNWDDPPEVISFKYPDCGRCTSGRCLYFDPVGPPLCKSYLNATQTIYYNTGVPNCNRGAPNTSFVEGQATGAVVNTVLIFGVSVCVPAGT